MPRRLYLAVLPPVAVVERLDEQLAAPRARAEHERARIRWSNPANWHVTLLFCPGVDEDQLGALHEELDGVAAAVPGFPLAVAGGDAFPELARAGHLVADLDDPTGSLPRLAADFRSLARELGVEHATDPFRPHLTLARLPRSADRTHDATWLEQLRTDAWPVDDVALVESHVQASGPARHQVLARFPLG